MRPFIEAIAEATESYVICYPNAGKNEFLTDMSTFRPPKIMIFFANAAAKQVITICSRD